FGGDRTDVVRGGIQSFAIGGVDRSDERIHPGARRETIDPCGDKLPARVELARTLPEPAPFRIRSDERWTRDSQLPAQRVLQLRVAIVRVSEVKTATAGCQCGRYD